MKIIVDLRQIRIRTRIASMGVVSILVLMAVLTVVVTAYAATLLDVSGYLDYSYGAAVLDEPTDGRPESKLWWNDGIWWGNLYNPIAGEYQIYYLNWNSQTWISTDVAVDDRETSRADVLWDPDSKKLYIASHVKLENPSRVTGKDNWARLYRYSYDPSDKSYTLDFGFPVIVNEDKTRTLVLDKDSTGRLWITYVSREINGTEFKVYVNTTIGDDRVWGIPFPLPFQPQGIVDLNAVSALIAFEDDQGPKIGLMWSNELDGKFYFASHLDSEASASGWSLETGLNVPFPANDHVNLAKTSNGQVFAAVKTFATGIGEPIIALVARDTDGTFSFHPVSPAESNDSRPIVLVDEGSNQGGDEQVYVFMGSNPTGGAICYLTAQIVSPLSDIAFVQRLCGNPGLAGAPQILADTKTYQMINNVTSTKQTLNNTTDMVILASDEANGNVYVHGVVKNPLPSILSRWPEPDAEVPSGKLAVIVAFSKNMDASSINTSSFFVEDQNGKVLGDVVYSPSNLSASFTPSSPWGKGFSKEVWYKVTLTEAVKDETGQPLINAPMSWTFTTRGASIFLPLVVR